MNNQDLLNKLKAFIDEIPTNEDSSLASEAISTFNGFKMILGKSCIVRTYSAGVMYGTISHISENGKVVGIKNARRIWKWSGAASLSQLAQQGTSLPADCKFPVAVEYIVVTEVIEILLLTEVAKVSLDSVQIWKE